MNILIVEDDEIIRAALENYLKREGYSVLIACDGEQAITLFEQQQVDLIVLDLLLPKVKGDAVLKHIRQISTIPIIIISALNDEILQRELFQYADDYIVKPFSIKLLVYKVNALIRRVYTDQSKNQIIFDSITLNLDTHEVIKAGEVIDLTIKEFSIIQILYTHPGIIYNREQLILLIWGYDFIGDDRIIDAHVKNIRKKLGYASIQTKKGIGYCARIEERK